MSVLKELFHNDEYLDSTYISRTNSMKYCREYAKLMCEQQRELCAENATVSRYWEYDWYDNEVSLYKLDIESIINSPLPSELRDE